MALTYVGAFLNSRKGPTPMDVQSVILPLILAMSIPSAITGFCFWLLERKIQKRDEENKALEAKRQKELDEREQQRKKYEVCQLNMTAASMALAEATAQAVQRIPDAHCNGDMHKALDYATKVKNDQKEFLRQQAVESLDF